MVRRGAAAATDNIHQTGLCPLTDIARHIGGIQVITAERIRQTGIRVSTDITIRDTGQLRHILAQFSRPQRTVQPERDRADVSHGVIKGFSCLTGQCPAGGISDRTGKHHRQFNPQRLKLGFNSVNRRLGIQGIEDCFDHNDISPAADQCPHRAAVCLNQRIIGYIAVSRIIHIGGD